MYPQALFYSSQIQMSTKNFVYTPNQPNVDFYSSITNFLLQRDFPNLIVMGDFNAVVSPTVDRSTHSDTDIPPNATMLRFIKELSLCDHWQAVNLTNREYTLFLCP